MIDEYLDADGTWFPETGGEPATKYDLLRLRDEVLASVEAIRSEADRDSTFNIKFDLAVGRTLHSSSLLSAGQGGDPEVWDFLTLVLLPDIASMRFSPDESDRDRFRGGSRRHVFCRLWRRWEVFDEPVLYSPSPLLEDDYGALLERNLVLVKHRLANELAHKIIEARMSGERRQFTRALMLKVMQMSGVIWIDDSDPNLIASIVERATQEVRNMR